MRSKQQLILSLIFCSHFSIYYSFIINNISYEIHFDDYHKNFKEWTKRYKIKNVCIPYVTKGNWRTITKKIINDNPSINFIYLNRNYDKEAWKYSKKGFFNFKKHIPELITKINNERNFKN